MVCFHTPSLVSRKRRIQLRSPNTSTQRSFREHLLSQVSLTGGSFTACHCDKHCFWDAETDRGIPFSSAPLSRKKSLELNQA
ncbi:hypothetical protein HZ326_10189 [Fusarium oxysporum f. sp. albedinis]|nr:hypothetical protein HZ326_10189 [Fusarium oxysporum f. sp. albedinis]